MADIPTDLRIDKWLWAARFFKTRALASEAVAGGKVAINGQKCKPSRVVRTADQVTIQKGPYEFVITVDKLCTQGGPAKEAGALYTELETSRLRRLAQAEQSRLETAAGPRHTYRPGKRDRRLIVQFTRKRSGDDPKAG